jgi:site-specific DNA recombinase
MALHPTATARYRADLDRLGYLIEVNAEGECDETIQTIRRLIDSVTMYAPPGRGGFEIELRGKLAELTKSPDQFAVRIEGGEQVVARDGFEPPTQGL